MTLVENYNERLERVKAIVDVMEQHGEIALTMLTIERNRGNKRRDGVI